MDEDNKTLDTNSLENDTTVDSADDIDDAELDASISETISQVKAEHPGAAKPLETAKDSGNTDEGAETSTSQEHSPKDTESQTGNQSDASEFKLPVKGKFESDESFELRMQLFDLVKQKKAAGSQEEKDGIQRQIKELRHQMSEALRSPSTRSQSSISNDDASPEEAEVGNQNNRYLTEQDLIEFNQRAQNKVVIDSFFEKHPEFKDPDVKEVFVNFFDANYKLDGKDAKGVATVLELARSAMFKPSETIQERTLKAAQVQDKVNAMQFPGSTGGGDTFTPEQKASIDEMVSAGVPREKAIELVT